VAGETTTKKAEGFDEKTTERELLDRAATRIASLIAEYV
jgi:hypothetical protein